MEVYSITGMLCGIFEGFLGKLHIEFQHTHTHSLLRRLRTALGPLNVRDAVVADADWQGGRSVGWAVWWLAGSNGGKGWMVGRVRWRAEWSGHGGGPGGQRGKDECSLVNVRN